MLCRIILACALILLGMALDRWVIGDVDYCVAIDIVVAKPEHGAAPAPAIPGRDL